MCGEEEGWREKDLRRERRKRKDGFWRQREKRSCRNGEHLHRAGCGEQEVSVGGRIEGRTRETLRAIKSHTTVFEFILSNGGNSFRLENHMIRTLKQ